MNVKAGLAIALGVFLGSVTSDSITCYTHGPNVGCTTTGSLFSYVDRGDSGSASSPCQRRFVIDVDALANTSDKSLACTFYLHRPEAHQYIYSFSNDYDVYYPNQEDSAYIYGYGKSAVFYSKKPSSSSKTADRMSFKNANLDSEYTYSGYVRFIFSDKGVLNFWSRSGDYAKMSSKKWFDPINMPTFIGVNSPHRYATSGSGICQVSCHTTSYVYKTAADDELVSQPNEEPQL